MMEILHKAKRLDNGEWIEGYYTKIIVVFSKKEHHYISTCEVPFLVEIDPETVCVYTGLKDKNNRMIWENDIVLLREEIQGCEWKAVVKFGNPNCEYNWGWQLVPIGECEMNKDILLWIDMEIANCEVIGNTFDNPELMEVE